MFYVQQPQLHVSIVWKFDSTTSLFEKSNLCLEVQAIV